jgi:PmbA protein
MWAIAPAFDAERIAHRESFLCGKMNHAIAPSGLHVVDDAAMPAGLNTRAFDDWGVPPVPVPLIQEGVVAGFYLSDRQARRRGVRPSGHMSALQSVSPGNLIVRPGSRSRNMIFADLQKYLVATDLIEPLVLDLETGALELKVRLFLDSEDRSRGRLGTHVIQTDVLTLLSKIKQIGSDQSRFGAVDVGTWVLEGVTVTPGS